MAERCKTRHHLAKANEQRDCCIYESFADKMIAIARGRIIDETDFTLLITGNEYAFDSTTIDLWFDLFWLANFRKKGEPLP